MAEDPINVTLIRPDLFPASTVVKVYKGAQASSWSEDETLKATATKEATVNSSTTKLELTGLEEGNYTLFATVSSENRLLRLGAVPYNTLEAGRGPLKERLRIRKEEVGA